MKQFFNNNLQKKIFIKKWRLTIDVTILKHYFSKQFLFSCRSKILIVFNQTNAIF